MSTEDDRYRYFCGECGVVLASEDGNNGRCPDCGSTDLGDADANEEEERSYDGAWDD